MINWDKLFLWLVLKDSTKEQEKYHRRKNLEETSGHKLSEHKSSGHKIELSEQARYYKRLNQKLDDEEKKKKEEEWNLLPEERKQEILRQRGERKQRQLRKQGKKEAEDRDAVAWAEAENRGETVVSCGCMVAMAAIACVVVWYSVKWWDRFPWAE